MFYGVECLKKNVQIYVYVYKHVRKRYISLYVVKAYPSITLVEY